ncbi:hypothetical protein [Kineococcus sp. SYSU DK006]|uniref:hypothetical protein n=1 Tax=Kineococcus sp. SYSU DK006 TaxID=3383127 RepID=UPI003D7CF769
MHQLSYRSKPVLSADPRQLKQLHREHGYIFITTADQQVRAWLGPDRVRSAPGPDLSGTHAVLDECAREFLRYCPRGGVFAVRWHTVRVVHHPREQMIAYLRSPHDGSTCASSPHPVLGEPQGGRRSGTAFTASLTGSSRRERGLLREQLLQALGMPVPGQRR